MNIPLVVHPKGTEVQKIEQPTNKVNPGSVILWVGLCRNNYPPWLNEEYPRTLHIKVNGMLIDVTPWDQGQASLPQSSWPPAIQCCLCKHPWPPWPFYLPTLPTPTLTLGHLPSALVWLLLPEACCLVFSMILGVLSLLSNPLFPQSQAPSSWF